MSGKSPTADEPYHALAGWLQLWQAEYRFVADHPPLWSELAAIVSGPHAIIADTRRFRSTNLLVDRDAEQTWAVQTLFRTPQNDGLLLIAKFRVVMLVFALAIGALLARFSWQLAVASGAPSWAAGAAAVFSTGLFSLDPTFLAHSPIVKNDVASALAFLGLITSVWSVGRALTIYSALALAIWSGLAMTVKFSAPLMIGISVLLLLLRALLPGSWRMGFRISNCRPVSARVWRLAAVGAVVLGMGAVTFFSVWLSYGFRFAASRDADARIDMASLTQGYLASQWQARHADDPRVQLTKRTLDSLSAPAVVRLINQANDRHLLPQAFLGGLLSAMQTSLLRNAFLLAEVRTTGWWWYFPFAILVKTPIATLVAFAAGIAALLLPVKCKTDVQESVERKFETRGWSALCLLLAPAMYLAAAMAANLNLGLRHVLPIYPLLFATAGLSVAKIWSWRPRLAVTAGSAVLLCLAIESCSAYPDYLPFFNLVAGGSRGGLRLLSDSNLDWGQDLPLLAGWQRAHPSTKLYLAYFGTTDPAAYGIRYINVEDGYPLGPQPQPISGPGVLAISATTLQGPYCPHIGGMPTWSSLWTLKPFDVLGGSIYLFHIPPERADHLPLGQRLIN